MIFVLGIGGELFCIFAEKDVKNMRDGHTTFIDQRQLKGASFKQVHFGIAPTDEEALKWVEQVNPSAAKAPFRYPLPEGNETICIGGCGGLKKPQELYQHKCIICWANEAKAKR